MSKKSKELIISSFMEILEENPYDVITICEVLANTPLERKTFYNNFKNKEDIVCHICKILIEHYITVLKRTKGMTLVILTELFYQFGEENKDIFTLLHNRNLFHFFVNEFNHINQRIDEQKPSFITPDSNLYSLSPEDFAFVFAFHSAGTLSMFELWVKTGFLKSKEEMVKMQFSIYKMYENTAVIDIDLWK